MTTGIETTDSGVCDLKSYLGGRWVGGSGQGHELVNPVNGAAVARCSTGGMDLAAALTFARRYGGPTLRALSFKARAGLLAAIADALAARRERWFEIAKVNSGNTKADAAIDIDGAIGTIRYFSRLGAGLGESRILAEGSPARLARDANFQGLHVGVPVKGVAVHINAYNFPAWGLWEKASVSLLSGVPVLAKPATATAWLAEEMVQCVVESGILPEGAISVACGPAYGLLESLEFGDVVCFTGSAGTGNSIRSHPRVLSRGVRVNIEADSLNAAILGPDAEVNGAGFSFFVREVVREMTVKAGQKCTAIRRILVPASLARPVSQAICDGLEQVIVGDPAEASVTMGPLVNRTQKDAVEEGIRNLASESQIVFQTSPSRFVRADAENGAFVAPALLLSGNESRLSNEIEVFGPVATVIPYSGKREAFSIAERGAGSLAASVFSTDLEFLAEAALELAPSHGRILLVDPSIGDSHTGHGIVLPSCIHGGPGRAGGGEELGGLRGLWFYHQRVAIQASVAVLSSVVQPAANVAISGS
ncbi:MAG TPA: 3,4-dehydroadipyl-CoA semialdehyde dehydrogenase [Bryobacteraceae bacterium]|nr:3,4-dehydroadipyl-CoA semialdehyde dehydrogenase [Bryobacteraceae bacterium]